MIKFSVLMPIGPSIDIDLFQKKVWKSITSQTLQPNEIVIVFDGLKSLQKKKLMKIIKEFKNTKVFEIPKQIFLADVLNIGLSKCKYEFIARVDADDINSPDRFKIQIDKIQKDKIDIIASSMKYLIGKKEKIKQRSISLKLYKFLNPLNHPTIIFNKKKILSIGGYPRFQRFEDYALWFKCINNNFKIENISEPLVYTYVDSDFFRRRSGWKYFIFEIKFQIYIYRNNYINFSIFIFNFLTRSFISLFGTLLKPFIFKNLF